MIHIRIDQSEHRSGRRFACGIGPDLPEGDQWFYDSEIGSHYRVDCPGCRPQRTQIGIPASAMNGNAAERHANPQEWDNWVRFCEANGHY
jgi:hypothetical protein